MQLSTTIYVSDEILERFPDLRVEFIVAAGLDNTTTWSDADAAIDALEADAAADALQRRLARQGRLPRINGAVNAYNAASVLFCVPAGAFDLDQLAARVDIRFATTQDRFTPLGEPDTVETPNVGEVVYAQGTDVLTRHWNHRDAHHTRVHETTRFAVFMLERVSPAISPEHLLKASEYLRSLLASHASSLSTATLSADVPQVELADADTADVATRL